MYDLCVLPGIRDDPARRGFGCFWGKIGLRIEIDSKRNVCELINTWFQLKFYITMLLPQGVPPPPSGGQSPWQVKVGQKHIKIVSTTNPWWNYFQKLCAAPSVTLLQIKNHLLLISVARWVDVIWWRRRIGPKLEATPAIILNLVTIGSRKSPSVFCIASNNRARSHLIRLDGMIPAVNHRRSKLQLQLLT